MGHALLAASLFGQGSLTPPGTPAPTMKTLDQVEARTVVNATNTPASGSYAYNVTTAAYPSGGSFYLTGNLSVAAGGVYIAASNVTLDLNGFSVVNTGSGTTASGVYVTGSNVTIRDGGVKGAFANGIVFSNAAVNALVKNANVSGASSLGISLANGVVQSSTVYGVGSVGITAPVVSDSSATACGTVAVSAQTATNTFGTTNVVGQVPVIAAQPQEDQRIAIPGGTNLATYGINAPGSYYLTGNFNGGNGDAIYIGASDVTLDLNGFTISTVNTGTGGNASGVRVDGGGDVTVRNGHILGNSTYNSGTNSFSTNPGFYYAVFINSGSTGNIRLEDLTTSGTTDGLWAGSTSGVTISHCQVSNHSSIGIIAQSTSTVDNSTAQTCGDSGITAGTVQNCTANVVNASATATAINATNVLNSSGLAARGIGIAGTTVTNCFGQTQGTTSSECGISCPAGVANACKAISQNAGGPLALKANIAIGCVVSGSTSITNKYLMP